MHTYCRTVGVFSLLFIHCDKGGHGDDGLVLGTGASVTHAVGVGGGEIELEGTTLDIPAGALAKDVDITLTSTTEAAPEGYANLSPVFRRETSSHGACPNGHLSPCPWKPRRRPRPSSRREVMALRRCSREG